MDNSNHKTIICMAAGQQQMPVIKAARNLNLKIIGIDQDKMAPGFKLCDVKIVCSTYDVDAIWEKIESILPLYNIVAVINRSAGPPVVSTAALCKKLNIEYSDPNIVASIVNKNILIQTCIKNNLPVPNSIIISSLDDLNISELKYPVIIKPAFSLVGKSGVTLVNNQNQVCQAIIDALSCSVNNKVIISDYIDGDDIILLSIVKHNKLIPITLIDELNCITDRKIIPSAMAIPSKYLPVMENIVSLGQKIIEVFNINNSPFNLSCRYDRKGNLVIIEIHLDMGGDKIYDILLPRIGRVNSFESLINCLAFGKCDFRYNQNYSSAVIFSDLVSETPKKVTARTRNKLNVHFAGKVYV